MHYVGKNFSKSDAYDIKTKGMLVTSIFHLPFPDHSSKINK